jgi:hypothetical protein
MIRITRPELTASGDGTLVRAAITGPGLEYDLWFDSSAELEVPCAEPFLIPAVLAGMAIGQPIESDAPVSRLLLERLTDLQRLYATWYPSLSHVEVHAPIDESAGTEPPAPGAATFFSAGVDSFATVVRHRRELTGLLLMRGSDVDLTNDEQWAVVRSRCQRAADELGLPLITVASNVRRLTEFAGEWNTVGHGAGLAAIAQLFQRQYRRVFIASSFSVADMFPWGSHPLLDPLFSTERTAIEHDALALTRLDKVRLIATDEVALRHVRVCIKQTGAYNCGNCEKCLRTAVNLHLAGALGRCKSFPYDSLPVDRLGTLWVPDEHSLPYLRENIRAARHAGDAELVELLESALWRYQLRSVVTDAGRIARSARLSRVTSYARRALARVAGLNPAHQQ